MDSNRFGMPIIGSTLGLIAKRLRAEGDSVARQALPKRWVELLCQLNEEERRIRAGEDTSIAEDRVLKRSADRGRSD